MRNTNNQVRQHIDVINDLYGEISEAFSRAGAETPASCELYESDGWRYCTPIERKHKGKVGFRVEYDYFNDRPTVKIVIHWFYEGGATITFKSWEAEKRKNNLGGKYIPTSKANKTTVSEMAARKKKDDERIVYKSNMAKEYIQAWRDGSTKVSTHAYVQKKGINQVQPLRRVKNNSIALPLLNIDGEMYGVQVIDNKGGKKYHGPKKGNFCVIGDLEKAECYYFVEGYATGSAVFNLVGLTQERYAPFAVIVALDAHNLVEVVSQFKANYPSKARTVCPDNDYRKKVNAGLKSGVKAAVDYQCEINVPLGEHGDTDWCDAYLRDKDKATNEFSVHNKISDFLHAINADPKPQVSNQDVKVKPKVKSKLKVSDKHVFADHLIQGNHGTKKAIDHYLSQEENIEVLGPDGAYAKFNAGNGYRAGIYVPGTNTLYPFKSRYSKENPAPRPEYEFDEETGTLTIKSNGEKGEDQGVIDLIYTLRGEGETIKRLEGVDKLPCVDNYFVYKMQSGINKGIKVEACGNYLDACDDLHPSMLYDHLTYMMESIHTKFFTSKESVFKCIPDRIKPLANKMYDDICRASKSTYSVTRHPVRNVKSNREALEIIMADPDPIYLYKAEMGAGKTQEVMKPLCAHFGGSATAIAPTVSLTRSTASVFTLDLYSSNERYRTNGIATTINSLFKVPWQDKKLILIDEIQEVFKSWLSGTVKEKRIICDHLQTIFSDRSKTIVGADANLSDTEVEIIRDLISGLTDREIVVLELPRSKKKHKIWLNCGHHSAVKETVINYTCLKTRKDHAFIACDSKKTVQVLALGAKNALAVHKYTTDSDEVKKFLTNPTEYSKDKDIIASPSLSSGVSMTPEAKFTKAVGIFSGVVPANSMVQQIMRVRGDVERFCTLPTNSFGRPKIDYETNVEALLKYAYANKARLNAGNITEKMSKGAVRSLQDKTILAGNIAQEEANDNPVLNRSFCRYQALDNMEKKHKRMFCDLRFEYEFDVERIYVAMGSDARKMNSELTTTAEKRVNKDIITSKNMSRFEYEAAKADGSDTRIAQRKYEIQKTMGSFNISDDDVHFCEHNNGNEKIEKYQLMFSRDEDLINSDRRRDAAYIQEPDKKKIVYLFFVNYFGIDLSSNLPAKIKKSRLRTLLADIKNEPEVAGALRDVFGLRLRGARAMTLHVLEQIGLDELKPAGNHETPYDGRKNAEFDAVGRPVSDIYIAGYSIERMRVAYEQRGRVSKPVNLEQEKWNMSKIEELEAQATEVMDDFSDDEASLDKELEQITKVPGDQVKSFQKLIYAKHYLASQFDNYPEFALDCYLEEPKDISFLFTRFAVQRIDNYTIHYFNHDGNDICISGGAGSIQAALKDIKSVIFINVSVKRQPKDEQLKQLSG